MNRRKFLGYAAMGLGLGLGGSALFKPFNGVLTGGTEAAAIPNKINPRFQPDVEIALKAVNSEVQILPGKPTQVFSYRAEVLRGDKQVVQDLPDTYLGPIFRLRKGQKVRVHFTNEINQETIVHWHGLHVPEQADGHPRYVIEKGETYVYEFEVKDRAGTYWFHPHPHGRTGSQVYGGLAGLLLISDEEEQQLDLPRGELDLPLVIQDRTFDRNNQLVYLGRGMMERMFGFLGNTILVNGKPDAVIPVASRIYRFRLLNGSNSRIYKIAWNDGTPLTVIGTDGGLLETPVQKNYLMLGPAERIDLWVDFSGRKVGSELVLKSLPFSGAASGGMGMMGGGMMGGGKGAPPNGAELNLLTVRVVREEKESRQLPSKLARLERLRPEEAVNRSNPRTFRFEMQHMQPTINGRTFQMTKVASDEIVRLNTVEMWELVNRSGGMGMMGGMQIPHPVHIHGLQYQIVERSASVGWETIKDGFVDNGWKDSVLLMPGMRVKILLRFRDYTGLFLYHCHNLEHEDLGMMRNYLVRA